LVAVIENLCAHSLQLMMHAESEVSWPMYVEH